MKNSLEIKLLQLNTTKKNLNGVSTRYTRSKVTKLQKQTRSKMLQRQ